MTRSLGWIPSGARRRALGAALLAAVAAGVLVVRAPAALDVDLCTYRAAGALALAGRPADAYDGAALAAMHRTQHDLDRRVGGFLYSPLWLAPAMPLAALSLEGAERASRLAGALALAAGLGLVLHRVRAPGLRVAVAAAFCLSHAAWTQLIYLNWTFLLFLALAVATATGGRGRGVPAALAWALAIHLKLFVALALAPLAATREWRRVVAAAAALLALALLALAWSDLDSWRAFAARIIGVAERGVTPYYNKVSLPASVARFLVEPRAWLAPRAPVDSPWVLGASLAGLPLLAWATVRLRRDPQRLSAFAIAWVLLFVPQVWDHTELLLFLVVPVLPARWAWTFTLLLAATVFYNPVLQDLLGRTLTGELPPLAARCFLLLYPALALLALAATLVEPDAGPEAVAGA